MSPKELTSQQAVFQIVSDNKHPSVLSKTLSSISHKLATTPGVRLVSLAQLSNTYDMAVPMREYMHCTTYARAQLMARPA
jgi:hypothetical protein